MEVFHTFSIAGDHLPDGVRVVAFRGSEAISRPYRVEAFLLVPEAQVPGLDPRDLLGRRATITTHRATGEARRAVHGMWSSIAMVRPLPGGDALYRAVISPRLWRLTLARRSRVFVDRTVPEIVEAVLRGCGFEDGEYVFRLENPRRYTALEHVCQYRESDFEFFSRRLEHEGIYYYFEHPDEGTAERLVITDSATFAEPLSNAPLRFLSDDEAASGAEGLSAVACQYSAVPSGARTHGYNHLTPSVDVGGESLPGADERFVVSSWEPARTDAEGRRIAAVRAEELRARESLLEASGRVFDARAGYLFELDEHPILSGEHLCVGVEYRGCDVTAHRELAKKLGFGGGSWEVELTAIPGDVQFRPERVTERPRVHGMELGVVRGPMESPYAQVDEHGRYLVQLKLDEDAGKVTPSTRMRMAQPHGGGGGTGYHFPLRNGTEVLVGFVRGDPDCPVIASVVPNAEAPSPITSGNATKNIVQTGGGNRMVMEDQEGSEYVKWQTPFKGTYFHIGAPHNPAYVVDTVTDGDARIKTGDDYDVIVGGCMTRFVTSKVWERFGVAAPANWDPNASGDPYPAEMHRVDITGTRATEVSGNVTETYRANQTTAVTGNRSQSVAGTLTQSVTGAVAQTYASTLTRGVAGDQTTTVGGDLEETITGDWTVTCASKDETVLGEVAVTNCASTGMLNMGGKQAINMSATTQVSLAAAVELTIGAMAQMDVGPRMEIGLGMKLEIGHGLRIEIAKGLKAEMTYGLKYEDNQAVELSSGALSIKRAFFYMIA